MLVEEGYRVGVCADCDGDCRVEAESFVADAVEERGGFEFGGEVGVGGNGLVGRGEGRVDFLVEGFLNFGVFGDEVGGPCESGRGGFVAGGEKSEELVDELDIGEVVGSDAEGENVLVAFGFRLDHFLLFGNEFEANVGQCLGDVLGTIIELEWETSNELGWTQDLAGKVDLLLKGRLQKLFIDLDQWIVAVLECLKVPTHCCQTNNVDRDFGRPVVNFHNRRLAICRLGGLDDLLADSLHHLHRLGPEDGIQFLDMSKAKDGHEILAEKLVRVSFHND